MKMSSKRTSAAETEQEPVMADTSSADDRDLDNKRRIYFNLPLPDDARDEEGRPLFHFARNKIRTAKYTPISFVPKNLWFQFHNVANIYFAFIIVLGFFSIFGAANPGLNAVPLIFILSVTALKDAFEDWRRTTLDAELNNSPVHRLCGYNNVNTAEEKISLWRRFKKANSRATRALWQLWQNRKAPEQNKRRSRADLALDESRPSIESRPRLSTVATRMSHQSARSRQSTDTEQIQMTPVPSPIPENARPSTEKALLEGAVSSDNAQASSSRPSTRKGAAGGGAGGAGGDGSSLSLPPKARAPGSLINPNRKSSADVRFKKDFWKNVQVGDFLRLYDGEEVPSDMVVLSSSDVEGICYLETKNLDGETNLKVRNALRCGRKIRHARHCEEAEFSIESEGPQANLYNYNGVIRWKQYDANDAALPPTDMAEPISINNLLLRGSTVRNTEWVLGVAVFTGKETKIMLNSGITPSKRAKISKDLNWNVIYNFIILFFMCLVAAIVQGTTWGQGNNSLDYFEYGGFSSSAAVNGFITFWAAVILVQNLVPISLYISLEIIRTLQAVFIYSDVAMYYAKLDYPCTPKTWNISDDVGQIEYIFSDKTGTLTQNVMEFKKVTINNVSYGEAYTEALAGMQRRQGVNVEEEGEKAKKDIEESRVRMLKDSRELYDNPYLIDDNLTFVAPDFVNDLGGKSGPEQETAVKHFMLALALTHTVIAERTPGDPPTVEFKAQSPDEAALVATARDVGFTVLARTNDGLKIDVLGEERFYSVLNILEFNSTRKRMGAIIRMPDGKIILFCKGADSMIYSRLRPDEQAELRQTTAAHLEMYAREGLRTLCVAQREIDEKEYQNWNRDFEIAAASLTDREDKLDAVADIIERDLTLLGGTAIEDRLQDGVPDAIQLLAEAGIKLWVLTGDKVETAINIGFSCNLLNNDMDLIVLKVDEEVESLEEMGEVLDSKLAMFNMTGSDEELEAARHNHEPPDPTHAIVIDGDALKLVLHESLKQKFLLLCKQCRSVLCCRVSPSQKAAVVRMVKQGLDCLTMSIGDGANDVAMIQEAHVGIGIAGEEGRQAVMSSDFAIGQFRYLTRLVLVHGRWSYRRLAETIANFFYKNLVWTFALFWYQIYDNFDCTYIYDYTYIILFNLAFTSLPVILMGVLDQDVDDKVSLAVPQLYRRGIERKEWTQPKFWAYMVDGLYQSVMVYFTAYLLFSQANFVTHNGLNVDDQKRIGVYIASNAVIVANLYVLFNTYRWDWLMLLIVVISTLLTWFWTGLWTASTNSSFFYKAAPQVYGQLSFWALLPLTTIVCLLPRFSVKAVQKMYFPSDVDIIREQVREGKFDYLHDSVDGSEGSPEKAKAADSASDNSQQQMQQRRRTGSHVTDDMRPIINPDGNQTLTTLTHPRPNNSDGTQFTGHTAPASMVSPLSPEPLPERLSTDRATPLESSRPSYDRAKASMDVLRPSFEQSDHFTSAALLHRMESTRSGHSVQSGQRLSNRSTIDEAPPK